MAQKHFYKVIHDCELRDLEAEVTRLLNEGYELVGEAAVDNDRWYLQTLVKHT